MPTYIKRHSTAVLLTLELAGAMVKEILPGVREIRNTTFHKNVWTALERWLATSKHDSRSSVSTMVLEEDKCWDPIKLIQFWHNFSSAAAMTHAKWPATLITKLIRAKALVILRIELAARSADVTSLSWALISPRVPIKLTATARRQISVQLYNTKPDKIKKNFGKLTPAKFLYETKGSNACVVKTLNELYSTTPFENVDTRDEFDPIFVSEKVSKDKAGKRRFKGLSSQRLSNIVRLSYIGAQIKSLLSKHIRSMASSKVDIVGIPEKVFLSHFQWSSMQTFKKYYKKKFLSNPPEVTGASFSDALHAV